LIPAFARSSAACMPPTTTRRRPSQPFSTGTLFGMRSSRREVFATAILTASFAFSVASSGWCMCTPRVLLADVCHLKPEGVKPPISVAPRNVGSCRRGEQAATTTPVRFCSLMASTTHVLTGSRAHVLILVSDDDVRERFRILHHRLDVDDARNVGTAVAHKNANSWIFVLFDFCHVFAPPQDLLQEWLNIDCVEVKCERSSGLIPCASPRSSL